MLTPAEALGLSGLSLASRVRNAFLRIPERELIEIAERVQEECRRRHLSYFRDGREDVIHVMPLPLTVAVPIVVQLPVPGQVDGGEADGP